MKDGRERFKSGSRAKGGALLNYLGRGWAPAERPRQVVVGRKDVIGGRRRLIAK